MTPDIFLSIMGLLVFLFLIYVMGTVITRNQDSPDWMERMDALEERVRKLEGSEHNGQPSKIQGTQWDGLPSGTVFGPKKGI